MMGIWHLHYIIITFINIYYYLLLSINNSYIVISIIINYIYSSSLSPLLFSLAVSPPLHLSSAGMMV